MRCQSTKSDADEPEIAFLLFLNRHWAVRLFAYCVICGENSRSALSAVAARILFLARATHVPFLCS
jgi:hypothetical protein